MHIKTFGYTTHICVIVPDMRDTVKLQNAFLAKFTHNVNDISKDITEKKLGYP